MLREILVVIIVPTMLTVAMDLTGAAPMQAEGLNGLQIEAINGKNKDSDEVQFQGSGDVQAPSAEETAMDRMLKLQRRLLGEIKENRKDDETAMDKILKLQVRALGEIKELHKDGAYVLTKIYKQRDQMLKLMEAMSKPAVDESDHQVSKVLESIFEDTTNGRHHRRPSVVYSRDRDGDEFHSTDRDEYDHEYGHQVSNVLGRLLEGGKTNGRTHSRSSISFSRDRDGDGSRSSLVSRALRSVYGNRRKSSSSYSRDRDGEESHTSRTRRIHLG